MMSFFNTPATDWTVPENRKRFEEDLSKVKESVVYHQGYPVCIDGKEYTTSKIIESYDPCDRDFCLGLTYETGADGDSLIEKAIDVAYRVFPDERFRGPHQRVDLLLRVAKVLEDQRFLLASYIVFEVGKTWDEAMGEVDEAIDFVRLYADAVLKWSETVRYQPGIQAEGNFLQHVSRGFIAGVSTWNFPLSLSVEKIALGVATGSPVLFKPAEQSPVVGWQAVKCFLDAGVSPAMISFLPGTGITGEMLVRSEHIGQIVFTGSQDVGLHITRLAAQTPSVWGVKRVDAEMGGINSIIVCPSANMEIAIPCIVRSKWGFNGQKCSALQRLIFVGDEGSRWIRQAYERIFNSAESLEIGHPAYHRHVTLTSLIEKSAYEGVLLKIEEARKAHDKVVSFSGAGAGEGEVEEVCAGWDWNHGWYMKPVIFYDLPLEAYEYKGFREEVFGPVLHIFCVPSLQMAITLANATDYAQTQTGGIFTECESDAEYFIKSSRAGNKYVNRVITGAKPYRQPFGYDEKVGCLERLGFALKREAVSTNRERFGFLIR